jgi:hypothetical protein
VGCCYYKFKPKEGQQFNLPIKATVVDDTNATATAIDSAISYGAKLVATKKYNKKLLSLLQANYDLNYTLSISNQGQKAATTDVMVDGQLQKMVLLVDELPANTTFKSAQSKILKLKFYTSLQIIVIALLLQMMLHS